MSCSETKKELGLQSFSVVDRLLSLKRVVESESGVRIRYIVPGCFDSDVSIKSQRYTLFIKLLVMNYDEENNIVYEEKIETVNLEDYVGPEMLLDLDMSIARASLDCGILSIYIPKMDENQYRILTVSSNERAYRQS